MAKLACIILAAGRGTRMKSDIPKVLHQVAGKSMLAHVVDAAKNFGAEKTIVVASPENKDALSKEVGAQIVVQENAQGTGDAVKAAEFALKDFDGNVLILYGDCPLIGDAAEGFEPFFEMLDECAIGMIAFEAVDPTGYGRLIIEEDRVEEIVEHLDATEEELEINLCNSGVFLLKSDLLFNLLGKIKNDNAKEEYYLTDIVKIANKEGLDIKFGIAEEYLVMGVNDKLDLSLAEEAMQNSLRQKALLSGVTMLAPETVFLSADTEFGKDVTIKQNVVIGENVTIGDNVSIGPFAHIRPGTKLGNNSRIGNFVETKNSQIGEGSKINHLSYVGDSELGTGVNVGAGTITCNYDGENKHKTLIEDNVFVGSNTALVAPVKVGKDSTIAAGSTITDDVENNSLAIARERQIAKKKK